MRLASLTVVAALLLAVGPTIAEHTDQGWHTVEADDPFVDWMDIEEDAYVKPGWWSGESMVEGDGGFAVNLSAMEAQEEQKAHWLYVNDSFDPVETSPVYIDVESQGNVVAAVDVFKVRPDGKYITPDCPQTFAEELYPDADRISWAIRVSHEATNFHQRAAPDDSTEVELFPQDATHGYLVAIYPQAASAAMGDARIEYTVSFEDPEDDMRVKNGQAWKAPDQPFHMDQWIGEPGVGPLVECVDKGIALPDELTEDQIQELPGTGTAGEQIASLLDTHIGE